MMGTRPLVIHCTGPDQREVLRVEPPALGKAPCHIHFAELAELRPREEELRSLLDAQELARAARFKFDHDRERFVLGHGWMRELLAHYLNNVPASIRMERGRFGKPFLPSGELYFNLSDTKDAIAFALCRAVEIGVDVETVDRRVDHDAVSGHYFTQEEQHRIVQSEQPKRTFLEFWTRKEAVLKASGVGIMDDLRSLRVDEAVNKITIAHPEFIAMAAAEYHVRTWRIGEGHSISLASPKPVEQVLFFGA